MSTALYRRYRPESFADVIGQEHVTEPLMAALEKNRVNHAYLFSGPRGCGKTTSARILARCLNCVEGPTPTPCGKCESCRDLSRDGGGSLDVIEMDAASHGGVDHARDLRERASFAPVRDRYKIFIIDEAHMVTREGFNALLKIVEEPPAHIKFIFATTEPNKVLGTIRSRTHHYPFRLVPPETLHNYLAQLCQEENVAVQPGVLQLVVRAGGGSVRDSLSILDQLMAGSGSKGITYDLAVALLGFTHGELLDGVVDALAAADASAVFEAVNSAIQSGQDPRRFVEDLLERFRDLLMLQAVPDVSQSVLRGMPEAQLRSMRAQAERLTTGDVTRAAELTSEALNEMSGSTNPQLTLELMCARIMLATSESDTATLGTRLDRIEKRLASGDFTAPVSSGQSGMAQISGSSQQDGGAQVVGQSDAQPAPANPEPASQNAPAQSSTTQTPTSLAVAPLAEVRRPEESTPAPSNQRPPLAGAPRAEVTPQSQQVAPQPRPNQAASNVVELAKTNWRDVLAQISSPTARHWFEQCTPSKYEDGQLFIRATMDVLKMVKPHIEELAGALYRVLELQVRIRAEVAKPTADRPVSQTGQNPAQTQPAQSQPAPHQQAEPQQAAQQIAEGPRAGEQEWAQHGQPRTEEPPQWSTDDWNNPVTSWDVAQIPSEESAEQGQEAGQAPAQPVAAKPNEQGTAQSQAPAQSQVAPSAAAAEPPAENPAASAPETDPAEAVPASAPQSEPNQPVENEVPAPFESGWQPVEPPQEEPAEDYISGASQAASVQTQPPAGETAAEKERRLSFRERHAAQIAAGARAAQPVQDDSPAVDEVEEFVPSDEDTALEETVLIGQRAVEKVLGGIVIDEQPLHN